MPFKTILVSLNHVSRLDALVSASVSLAVEHEAHLIGLYAFPAVAGYPTTDNFLPSAVMDSFKQFFKERSLTAKNNFDEAARMAGIAAEWRKVDSSNPDIADEVVQHGMQADLIVISQDDEKADDGIEEGFAERVVVESGRPVLVLPKTGAFKSIGDCVIVGWNASREAARATFDALPLLKASKTTRVTWMDPQDSGDAAGDLPGSELAITLARYGVDCTTESISSNNVDAGAALLQRASEVGADLIVMGAYGRSRVREYVLGGATRTMLKRMTVPVLMSH